MQRLLVVLSVSTLALSDVLFVTDVQRNETEIIGNGTNETDFVFEEYFPVLVMLINMPENETEALEKYMKQRTYAELKRMIDSKTREDFTLSNPNYDLSNLTDLTTFVTLSDNKKFIDIINAYHNASIYSLIRGVWNSQLHTLLPPIDQLAILEYFEERHSNQLLNMSFFSRLWSAIQRLFWRNIEKTCNADRPECMRKLVDLMEKEEREEIERAADNDDTNTVEGRIAKEVDRLPPSLKEEFLEWRADNYPPVALLNIIYDANSVEKDALQRLRTHGLLHSIKDYYRAMIEMRPQEEQEEIRQFFHRMNDTFARCYNPSKNKYESNGYDF